MAVIQVAFRHRRFAQDMLVRTPFPIDSFSHQVRRLVVSEATTWESADDIVIHWGDPACHPDAQALADSARAGEIKILFGRSWIHYHRPSQQLSFAVDRLGLFPILFAQKGQQSYVASDTLAMAQLLGSHAQTDDEALLELLAFGKINGIRSTLRGVQYLPPATHCIVDGNGNYQLQYAKPYYPGTTPVSREDALEALQSAVQRRLDTDPDALLSLSEGLDAWLLLAAAQASGHCPDLFSFSAPGSSLQATLARSLAKSCGAACYHGELSLTDFASAHATIAQFGGGETPLHHPHALICPELITQTRGTTLLTSIGSGAFRGFYYAHQFSDWEQVRHPDKLSFNTAKNWMLASFNPTLEPFLRAFPRLQERLRSELAARPALYWEGAENALHYLDSMYLGEHLPRYVVTDQQLLARDYARSHPFLDEAVLETFLALPLAQRISPQFYQQLIARFSPRLGRLLGQYPLLLQTHAGLAQERDNELGSALSDTTTHWLAAPDRDAWQLLEQALQNQGLSEGEIQNGIRILRHTGNQNYRAHIAGTLAAYQDWNHYINDRRAALAA